MRFTNALLILFIASSTVVRHVAAAEVTASDVNVLPLQDHLLTALGKGAKVSLCTVTGVHDAQQSERENSYVKRGMVDLQVDEAFIADERKTIHLPYAFPNPRASFTDMSGYVWMDAEVHPGDRIIVVWVPGAVDSVAGRQANDDGAASNVWVVKQDDPKITTLRRIIKLYGAKESELSEAASKGLADPDPLVADFFMDFLEHKWVASNPAAAQSALIQELIKKEPTMSDRNQMRGIDVLKRIAVEDKGGARARLTAHALGTILQQATAASSLAADSLPALIDSPNFPAAKDCFSRMEIGDLQHFLEKGEEGRQTVHRQGVYTKILEWLKE